MSSRRRTSREAEIGSKRTSRQRFWLKHLRACDAAGETMKGYAARKRLSVYGLYGARKRLRAEEAQAATPDSKNRVTFAKVAIRKAPVDVARCRVRLPNGVVMEWDIPVAAESLDRLLEAVARLS